MPSIIVLDTLSPDGLAMLDAAAASGITYEVSTGLAGDALRECLAQHDGAICRSGVKIGADALAGNHRLKAIVRAGVGTDNIDKDAATRQGIVVMNTPAGNTVSTAEHAFALLLAVFAFKAALLPLGFWLPHAYASAAAPVAALFAVLTKVGIYAMLRLSTAVFPAADWTAGLLSPWLMPAALGTILAGTIGVLAARRLGVMVAHLLLLSTGMLAVAVAEGSIRRWSLWRP